MATIRFDLGRLRALATSALWGGKVLEDHAIDAGAAGTGSLAVCHEVAKAAL